MSGRAAAVAATTTQNPLPLVSIAGIDPSYFDVLQTPMLSAAPSTAAISRPARETVIVDQGFVDQVLHGRNAIGRRVRFAAKQRPRRDA